MEALVADVDPIAFLDRCINDVAAIECGAQAQQLNPVPSA
jgi:hypothetical protein